MSEAREAWYAALGQYCAVCQSTHNLVGHHAVYAAEVRRCGGDIHDPRNLLTLCEGTGVGGCHSNHHARIILVPLSALSDENFAFAFELMGARAASYLVRRYANDDEARLERFLFAAALDEAD